MRWISRAAIAACVAVLVGCSSLSRPDDPARERCAENAEVVRAAKHAYQIGHNLPDGTAVTWEELTSCLPFYQAPVCPAGGKLEPGALGQPMKCSVHGTLGDASGSQPPGKGEK
jgi:hypothetical protein